MAGMLHELLLFARSGIESDRAPAASIHLATLVNQVLDSEGGNTNIVADVAEALYVQGYEAMIQRAVSNLVRNAKRYAADGAGPIEIQAWTAGSRVHLAVRDRGPGVPEAALARLGEPFFRPEAARSRATGGFGLGLAIVRRCMAACDAEVGFRNRPGGGFEADMSLPVGRAPSF
jgi:two-component system sensor histidine kinase CpxA